MNNPYTAEDVIEALAFLEKWPNPFAINEVEDDVLREELLDRYTDCLNIRKWNSRHGNGFIK